MSLGIRSSHRLSRLDPANFGLATLTPIMAHRLAPRGGTRRGWTHPRQRAAIRTRPGRAVTEYLRADTAGLIGDAAPYGPPFTEPVVAGADQCLTLPAGGGEYKH